MPAIEPVITRAAERPRETWDDPARGGLAWYTLFSAGLTPTNAITAGVAEVPPGDGGGGPHRHAHPELYYILEGTGILTIDGKESTVTAGSAIFIPGDAEHCLRNEADAPVRLLYVFAADSFSDVVYRFGN